LALSKLGSKDLIGLKKVIRLFWSLDPNFSKPQDRPRPRPRPRPQKNGHKDYITCPRPRPRPPWPRPRPQKNDLMADFKTKAGLKDYITCPRPRPSLRPPWPRPRPQKMVLKPVLRPRPVLRTTVHHCFAQGLL